MVHFIGDWQIEFFSISHFFENQDRLGTMVSSYRGWKTDATLIKTFSGDHYTENSQFWDHRFTYISARNVFSVWFQTENNAFRRQ